MKTFVALAVVVLLAALAYRSGTPPRAAAVRQPTPDCTCDLERARNGWCQACQVGHAASFTIRSLVLYDALDLHGHDIDPGSLECAGCREALRSDGFCSACKRGFLGERAYLSPLAYHLAKSEPEAVAEDLRLLALAIEASGRCELCAAAMVIDGTCPECLLAYRDGVGRPVDRGRR